MVNLIIIIQGGFYMYGITTNYRVTGYRGFVGYRGYTGSIGGIGYTGSQGWDQILPQEVMTAFFIWFYLHILS